MSVKTATAINALIVANPQVFAIGNTMSAAQWRATVKGVFALPRSVRRQGNHFSYVNSYVAFNRILRKRGMTIKSSNYYSQYTVIGLDKARIHAKDMITRGTAILNAGNELRANIPSGNRRYRFPSLKPAEITSVARYVTKPLTFK